MLAKKTKKKNLKKESLMAGEEQIYKAIFEQVFKLSKGKPISLEQVKTALQEQK